MLLQGRQWTDSDGHACSTQSTITHRHYQSDRNSLVESHDETLTGHLPRLNQCSWNICMHPAVESCLAHLGTGEREHSHSLILTRSKRKNSEHVACMVSVTRRCCLRYHQKRPCPALGFLGHVLGALLASRISLRAQSFFGHN